MRALLALLVFAAAAAPEAQTWPEPGEGFAWETVGDQPLKSFGIAFDAQGRIWSGWLGSPGGVARLDDPDDPAATWTMFDPFRGPYTVLPLGRGDTVLSGYPREIRRTTDGGATWAELAEIRTSYFYEVPALPGLPGDLRAGDLLSVGLDGFHRSTDRGATWAPVPGAHSEDATSVAFLPAGHPLAGRLLVSTTFGGVYVGEADADGALVMRQTEESGQGPPRVLEHLAVLPGGRVLATGYYPGGGVVLAFYSDDGGETWSESSALPEPADGIPGDAFLAVLGPQSALAVGGRGIVYRSDDGGASWSVVGRTPVTASNVTSQKLVVGPEGRLYVSLMRAGTEPAWLMRTASSVVSSEAEAPAASGAGLRVSPNPTSGAVRIEVTAPEAVEVMVVDARGREVARVASGARGSQVWEVDTRSSGSARGGCTAETPEASGWARR